MSQLLSSVVFLYLSLLWTINCENALRINVDYEVGKYGEGKRRLIGSFDFLCERGARFVISAAVTLKATALEHFHAYSLEELRAVCEFWDFSGSSGYIFVPNGEAPSRVRGGEEDPCTIYYDAKRLQAEEKNGAVQLKVLNTNEAYVLRLKSSLENVNDKARITHTTPVTDDPVTDDIVVLEHSAQSVDNAQIVESAESVNAEEGVTFKVKYEVGTYPNSQKRISLDKWDFKPDRKMEENPWVYASLGKDIKYLKFTCGPSKPVQLNCENEMCLSIAAVPANGDSGTIVAYVFKDKNKERYHLVKPKKKMPKRHFCTLLVSPESYKVGIPKLFYKRHINILRIGSEEKRGFRLFHRSFEALEE